MGELGEEFNGAIASYKGSLKKFLISIAEALDLPTKEPKYNASGDEVGEKALTVELVSHRGGVKLFERPVCSGKLNC